MEPDVEKLRSRREVMFAKVKWELSVAETLRTRNPTSAEVQERKDKLVQLAGNFETVQTAIEESTIRLEDVASVVTYRLQFEEVYYKVKGIYTAYLKEGQKRICNNSTGRGESSNNDLQDAVRALIKTQQAMIAQQAQRSGAAATGQVSNQCPALNVKVTQNRSEVLETYPASTMQANQVNTVEENNVKQNVSEEMQSSFVSDSLSSCAKCTKHHPTYDCKQFKRLDVAARRELAQTSKLCFNCLRPHHSAKQCPSASVCRTADCKQRHHTLLCMQEDEQPEATADQEQSSQERNLETSVNVTAPATLEAKSGSTLLPTVVARVKGRDGELHEVRAFIDCGSQESLNSVACVKRLGKRPGHATLELTGDNAQVVGTDVGMVTPVISSRNSEACVKRLRLRRSSTTQDLSGVNAEVVGTTSGKVTPVISTPFEDGKKHVTQAFVLGKLTAAPPCQRFNVSSKLILEGLQLTDPCFIRPGSVDVTLDSDVFLQDRLQAEQENDNLRISVAQRSICDWMAAGRISKAGCVHTYNSVIDQHQEVDINRSLRLFWEELHSPKQLTKEEERVVEVFNSTLTSTQNGRFIVRSMDGSKLKLDNSLAAVTSRPRATERKKDNSLKQRLTSFVEEYQQPAHMQLVPEAEDDMSFSKSHCVPHQGVTKASSIPPKHQEVLDGSCVTMTGASHNGLLLGAPNINADLFEVLLRFRSYPVVVTTDIKKLYRRLLLYPDDTDHQRIVRRNSIERITQQIRLLTVTYGLKSSRFPAPLHKPTEVFDQQCPEAAERIKQTNLNNPTSRADSVKEAKRLIEQMNEILSQAGFTQSERTSNAAQVLGTLTDISIATPIQFAGKRSIVIALGTHWLAEEDILMFKVIMPTDGPNTKHQQLTYSAELFDLFGWVAPVTAQVKILNWLVPLPLIIEATWIEVLLQEWIKTPHWTANYQGRSQLLSFSDVSERAYVAVVYLRSKGDVDGVHVGLIAVKTKVVAVNQVSITRQKPNTTELLTKWSKQAEEQFKRFLIEQYEWTDATVILQWFVSHSHNWDTYKAKRISSILRTSPSEPWARVAPNKNPADWPAWLIDDSATWRNVPSDAHHGATLKQGCQM